MCGRLSSSCDVIPEELRVRLGAMHGERAEHINRRITNYRKVTASKPFSSLSNISDTSHRAKLYSLALGIWTILCGFTVIETGCSWCESHYYIEPQKWE